MPEQIRPGDRVMVRNAAGGHISDDHRGEPIEYTVRETSPCLGVRLSDGWYALDSVDRVGGMRPVHPEPDPYVDCLLDERATWTAVTSQAVREGFEILRGAR